jgi:hypothetical protein
MEREEFPPGVNDLDYCKLTSQGQHFSLVLFCLLFNGLSKGSSLLSVAFFLVLIGLFKGFSFVYLSFLCVSFFALCSLDVSSLIQY